MHDATSCETHCGSTEDAVVGVPGEHGLTRMFQVQEGGGVDVTRRTVTDEWRGGFHDRFGDSVVPNGRNDTVGDQINRNQIVATTGDEEGAQQSFTYRHNDSNNSVVIVNPTRQRISE